LLPLLIAAQGGRPSLATAQPNSYLSPAYLCSGPTSKNVLVAHPKLSGDIKSIYELI